MPPVANPDVERWESDEDSENSGDEREGDEQEVALSEAQHEPLLRIEARWSRPDELGRGLELVSLHGGHGGFSAPGYSCWGLGSGCI